MDKNIFLLFKTNYYHNFQTHQFSQVGRLFQVKNFRRFQSA